MSSPEQEVDFRELAQEVRARLREMDRKLDMLSASAGMRADDPVSPVSDNKLLPHIPEALQIQHAWIPKSPRSGTPEPDTHNGDTGHAHFGKTLDVEIQPTWEPEPTADEPYREEHDGNGDSKESDDEVESKDVDVEIVRDASTDIDLHDILQISKDVDLHHVAPVSQEDEAAPLPVAATPSAMRFCISSPDRRSRIPDAAVEKAQSGLSGRPTSRKYGSEAQVLTQPRKRPPLLSRIYMFMEDAESSRMAHWYSVLMPIFTVATVLITLLQTHRPSVLNFVVAAVLETLFDLIFTTEFLLRFMTCPSYRAFFRCGYNLIDLACVAPLFLRAAIGFRISSMEETVASSILLCIVPLVRLLKTLRRFQEIQLLWSAFKNALEALPVLMYVALTMNLMFSALIFLIEPRWNVPTFGSAMWLTIVTMMTIGYGDITPKSDVGSIVVSVLIVCSVLYMAMPLGIVGQMFSQVWEQRDRILLMKRTRAALIQWGYQAHDIPMLFDLFDTDGDGYLTLQEFQQMIEFLDIGMSRSRVGRLFDTFDVDGGGTVSDAEFVRGLFPSEYHELFAPVGHKEPSEHWQDHQAELHARATQMTHMKMVIEPPTPPPEPNGDHKRRTSQLVVVRGRRGSTFVSRKHDAPLPNMNVRQQAEAFAAKGQRLSLRSTSTFSHALDASTFSHALDVADEEGHTFPWRKGSDNRHQHSSGRHVSFSQEREMGIMPSERSDDDDLYVM